MSDITIVDGICGSGKTQWAIQHMNTSPEDKFIYICPYLNEVERIKKFTVHKFMYSPEPEYGQGSKYINFKELIEKGKNIASTHSLFKKSEEGIVGIIKQHNYSIIVDEAIDVIEHIQINNETWQLLISNGWIAVDENTQRVIWNDPTKTLNNNEHIKYHALHNNLYLHTRNDLDNGDKKVLFVCTFPIEIFYAFANVYILTYLFNGQLLKWYFDINNAKYTMQRVVKNDNGYYTLEDYDFRKENRQVYKHLINIYEGEYNCIGKDVTAFSKGWLQRNGNKVYTVDTTGKKITYFQTIKHNTRNYFETVTCTPSKSNMWSTIKGLEDKRENFRLALKSKPYAKGFVSVNCKSTNEYAHKIAVAYLANRYLNPMDRSFFVDKGVRVDEDLWAVSELLQFLFRSAIRNLQPISLYLPSLRMRKLLNKWLNFEI